MAAPTDLAGAQVGRQEDAEDGAVALGCNRGAELDFASIALDDGACDPEAEAGATLAFGGKEGLAETALDFRGDTASGVTDGNADPAHTGIGPVASAANADAQAAVGQRGFDRVGDEVGEDLAHLARVDDSLNGAIVLALDAKILFHDAATVEREDLLEEGVDVGADGAGSFAREVKGLTADLGDAFELTLSEGEIVFDGGRQALFCAQQVEEIGDRLEGLLISWAMEAARRPMVMSF